MHQNPVDTASQAGSPMFGMGSGSLNTPLLQTEAPSTSTEGSQNESREPFGPPQHCIDCIGHDVPERSLQWPRNSGIVERNHVRLRGSLPFITLIGFLVLDLGWASLLLARQNNFLHVVAFRAAAMRAAVTALAVLVVLAVLAPQARHDKSVAEANSLTQMCGPQHSAGANIAAPHARFSPSSCCIRGAKAVPGLLATLLVTDLLTPGLVLAASFDTGASAHFLSPWTKANLCCVGLLATMQFLCFRWFARSATETYPQYLWHAVHAHPLSFATSRHMARCEMCNAYSQHIYACISCPFAICYPCFSSQKNPRRHSPADAAWFVERAAVAYYWNHKGLVLIIAITVIVGTVMELTLPSFTGRIIDAIVDHDVASLMHNLGLFAIISILDSALTAIEETASAVGSFRVIADMRVRFVSAVYFVTGVTTSVEDSASVLMNDVTGVAGTWRTLTNALVYASITFFGGIYMCITTSWRLFACAQLCICPVFLINAWYAEWSRDVNMQYYAALSKANAEFSESARSLRLLKAAGMRRERLQRYVDAAALILGRESTDQLGYCSRNLSLNILATATTVAILGLGGFMVINGHYEDGGTRTPGAVLQFQLYWEMFDGSWRLLNSQVNAIWRVAGPARRVLSVSRLVPVAPKGFEVEIDLIEGRGMELTKSISSEGAELGLSDVTFGFPGEPLVLEHVTFTFPPHALSVVLGPADCGKSVLGLLLVGALDPVEGHAILNGRDVRDWSSASRHRLVAYVAQEPLMFAGSVFDNLRSSASNLEHEEAVTEARRVLQIVYALEDVDAMRDGLDTRIGLSLALGFRQKLCIARALLKKPTWLIMDSCTSALDLGAEASIACAVEDMCRRGSPSEHCMTAVWLRRAAPIGVASAPHVEFGPRGSLRWVSPSSSATSSSTTSYDPNSTTSSATATLKQ